jgi:hypothetical protein
VAGVYDSTITVLQPNLTCAFGYNGVAPQRFPNINLPIGGTLNNVKFFAENLGNMTSDDNIFKITKNDPLYNDPLDVNDGPINPSSKTWTDRILNPLESEDLGVVDNHNCNVCGGPIVYNSTITDDFGTTGNDLCKLTATCDAPLSCNDIVNSFEVQPDKVFLGKDWKVFWQLQNTNKLKPPSLGGPGRNENDYCICTAECNDSLNPDGSINLDSKYIDGCGKNMWVGTQTNPKAGKKFVATPYYYADSLPYHNPTGGYEIKAQIGGVYNVDTYKDINYENVYKIRCYNKGYSGLCPNSPSLSYTWTAPVIVAPIPWYKERIPSVSSNILNRLGAYLLNLIGW